MGIIRQNLKALLHEDRYRPISGRLGLIGKSTVGIGFEELKLIVQQFDKTLGDLTVRDARTKRSSADFFVDDEELLTALFPEVSQVDVMDVSDYEGAGLIHDFNYGLPSEHIGNYDFLFDSSVLDNVFNPAQFIVNVDSLLKPGGRFLAMNVASFYPGALCSVHPEWLYGFFAQNSYADAKVYLTIQDRPSPAGTDLWLYRPFYEASQNYNHLAAVQSVTGIAHTIVIAEKPTNESSGVSFPTNLQYIHSSGAKDWTTQEEHFSVSARPVMLGDKAASPAPPHLTTHYRFLGTGF